MKVLAQVEDYRFVEVGLLEINGKPDLRLQMQDYWTKRWKQVYEFDNALQCEIAMEDLDYCKWLTNRPCYIRDDEEE
jgi:hypothetical protein